MVGKFVWSAVIFPTAHLLRAKRGGSCGGLCGQTPSRWGDCTQTGVATIGFCVCFGPNTTSVVGDTRSKVGSFGGFIGQNGAEFGLFVIEGSHDRCVATRGGGTGEESAAANVGTLIFGIIVLVVCCAVVDVGFGANAVVESPGSTVRAALGTAFALE